jgi:HSP20 family protein
MCGWCGWGNIAVRKEVPMTTLVKWSPFRELDLIDRRMRHLLDDMAFAPTPLPAVDAYETEDEFVLELEVPGYEEKELTIEAFDHTVAITGARQQVEEKADKVFRVHERLEKHFERRFELPPTVDTRHLTAVFEKGVLAVHAPKSPQVKPRKIAIAKG